MSIEKFKQAVDTGDVLGAILSLGHIEDLNFVYSQIDSITPLHYVVKKGIDPVATELIQRGANINVSDSLRQTPLHIAAEQGNFEIVSELIGAGATVDIANDLGFRPLHKASLKGHTDIVSLLLELKVDVDAKTSQGWTALHFAAWSSHVNVVSRLLQAGAIVNYDDLSMYEPLGDDSQGILDLLNHTSGGRFNVNC